MLTWDQRWNQQASNACCQRALIKFYTSLGYKRKDVDAIVTAKDISDSTGANKQLQLSFAGDAGILAAPETAAFKDSQWTSAHLHDNYIWVCDPDTQAMDPPAKYLYYQTYLYVEAQEMEGDRSKLLLYLPTMKTMPQDPPAKYSKEDLQHHERFQIAPVVSAGTKVEVSKAPDGFSGRWVPIKVAGKGRSSWENSFWGGHFERHMAVALIITTGMLLSHNVSLIAPLRGAPLLGAINDYIDTRSEADDRIGAYVDEEEEEEEDEEPTCNHPVSMHSSDKLWDDACKVYRGDMANLGRGSLSGMPGTGTAGCVAAILDYVHVNVFSMQGWGLYDPGAANGRMLALGIARGAQYAAGNELVGDAMIHVFDACMSMLGLRDRATVRFNMPIEKVQELGVHPSVDDNIFVYSFDSGWKAEPRSALYALVRSTPGVRALCTCPGESCFRTFKAVLDALGAGFKFEKAFDINMSGAQSHRHRTAWLFVRH